MIFMKGVNTMSRYETPDYEVVVTEGPYEIRKYADFFMMEYKNKQDPSLQNGFRSLFSYISGNNQANQKISMTVPVLQQKQEALKKIAFVFPKENSEQVPKPNSPHLTGATFKEGVVGTILYPGVSSPKKRKEMSEKLDAWISKKGYKKESPFIIAS